MAADSILLLGAQGCGLLMLTEFRTKESLKVVKHSFKSRLANFL